MRPHHVLRPEPPADDAPRMIPPFFALRELCRPGRPADTPYLAGRYSYWQQLAKSGVLRHWMAITAGLEPREVGVKRLGSRWYLSAATVEWLRRQDHLPHLASYLHNHPQLPRDTVDARRRHYPDADAWVAAQPLAALRPRA